MSIRQSAIIDKEVFLAVAKSEVGYKEFISTGGVFYWRCVLHNKSRPTQRAADGGYVPHFRAGFWLEAFPCRGLAQPSPPPLTQTVRQAVTKANFAQLKAVR